MLKATQNHKQSEKKNATDAQIQKAQPIAKQKAAEEEKIILEQKRLEKERQKLEQARKSEQRKKEKKKEKERLKKLRKKQRNKKISTIAASSSSSRFFQTQSSSCIAREMLPEALLRLGQQILKETGQPLILTGGAVESLFLNETDINDFDCLIPNVRLKELQEVLQNIGYLNTIIVGKHQVLKFKVDGVEFDISSLDVRKHLKPSLKIDAEKRDIKSTAMYLILSGQAALEIYDPLGAIEFLKKSVIDVNENPSLFKDDPIRLLRLAKSMLKRPTFDLSESLKARLRQIDFKSFWMDYFYDRDNAKLHRGRTQTKLIDLLKQFKATDVLAVFDKIGMISGLVGVDSKQLMSCQYLFNNIKHSDKIYKFYLITVALFFHRQQENKSLTLDDWPLMPVMYIEHQQYLNLLDMHQYFINKINIPENVNIEGVKVIELLKESEPQTAVQTIKM